MMIKKQEKEVTRKEFNSLSASHNSLAFRLNEHIEISKQRYEETKKRDEEAKARGELQQSLLNEILKKFTNVDELLSFFNTSKGFGAFIKNTGMLAGAISAIGYAVYNIKSWFNK